MKKSHAFGLRLALCLSLPAALAPRDALAVGEQYGRISGIITEQQSGAPIPGASVRVRSKALIGGPQTVQTGDDGSYIFNALPPGTYDVEISAEGVKPLKRKVVVRQGETTPLHIAWSVEMAGVEVTDVVEQRSMTRADDTKTGTVITADTQARVASARTYQAVTQQVAGVSGGSNPNVKGGQLGANRYLVDGMDITDPVTNTFSSNINFDSIASIEMLTGGMEAQYNSLGGVINLVTAAGGNEWHLDSSLYVNNVNFSLGQQYGSSVLNGVRPFQTADRPPSQSYQANVNLSGPLVKNRLWFSLSFEYLYRETANPIGPPLNVQHPASTSHRYLARLKLTWAPNEKHRITLSGSADPAFFNYANASNNLLAVADDRQNQGGVFSILQWDYFISQRANFNLQTGFQYSTIDYGPQGYFGDVDYSGYAGDARFSERNRSYDFNRPAHFNQDDGTQWYQGSAVALDRRYTFQFDPSFSLRGKALGTHDAKFGLQARVVHHTYDVQVPGGRTYTDVGGGDLESGICDYDPTLGVPQARRTGRGCYQYTDTPNYNNYQTGFSVGAFAQDRWKIRPWLAVNPGLRFDYGNTQNSQGETVSSLWGFGPRLGLLFDITRDQKTIFTAYYGRSNEVLSLLAASSADVVGLSSTYEFQQDEADPNKKWRKLYESGGPGGYRISNQLKAPHADEVTLSLRREVFANSSVSVDYTYKRSSNIWDQVEINQIWDPTGQRVLGYANGKAQQVFLYTTPDQNYRNYHGVDFVLESRPRQEWDFYLAYTLSFTYGPGLEQLGLIADSRRTQFYNPRMAQFYDGFLPEDQRHTLKLRASYNWKGFNAGAFMTYSTGRPLTKRYFNQLDGDYTVLRSPLGTEPGRTTNALDSISEFRLPDLLQIDMRVSYDFHGLIKQHLVVIADLFNAFNLGTPSSIEVRDVPNFAQVRARQQPFRLQLGLRYMF